MSMGSVRVEMRLWMLFVDGLMTSLGMRQETPIHSSSLRFLIPASENAWCDEAVAKFRTPDVGRVFVLSIDNANT